MERNDRSNEDEQAGTERSVPAGASAERGSEWERVKQTSAFGELVRRKKAFLIPAVIFFFVFFVAWPVLGGFTTVLDGQAIGGMTWAYVYGYALLLPTTLILLHLYMRRAANWDELAEKAREEAPEGRTNV